MYSTRAPLPPLYSFLKSPRLSRAPAPTPPTCSNSNPCADLAPTLPPTLPPTAANWRRTPWLALPCAVCADRRRQAPTGRPAPAVAEPDAGSTTTPRPRSAAPRAAHIHIQLRMPNILLRC
jgi:hypothetical protein